MSHFKYFILRQLSLFSKLKLRCGSGWLETLLNSYMNVTPTVKCSLSKIGDKMLLQFGGHWTQFTLWSSLRVLPKIAAQLQANWVSSGCLIRRRPRSHHMDFRMRN